MMGSVSLDEKRWFLGSEMTNWSRAMFESSTHHHSSNSEVFAIDVVTTWLLFRLRILQEHLPVLVSELHNLKDPEMIVATGKGRAQAKQILNAPLRKITWYALVISFNYIYINIL